MSNIIKKYIRLLIESNSTGWAELDDIISELRSVSKFNNENQRKDEDLLIDEYTDIVEKNGYDLLGFGHSRKTFSKPDLPWVIKITRDADSDWNYANKIEYNKYFDEQIDNELMPKIYSFDTNAKLWIIQEKVQKIESMSQLQLLFPYFSNQLKKINEMTNLSTDFNNDPNDYWLLIADLIKMANEINLNSLSRGFAPAQHYEYYFEVKDDFGLKQRVLETYSEYLQLCNQNYSKQEIKKILLPFDLDITDDILYVSKHIYTAAFYDLILSNLGYSLTLLNQNKRQGFKAIKFFDYAE